MWLPLDLLQPSPSSPTAPAAAGPSSAPAAAASGDGDGGRSGADPRLRRALLRAFGRSLVAADDAAAAALVAGHGLSSVTLAGSVSSKWVHNCSRVDSVVDIPAGQIV